MSIACAVRIAPSAGLLATMVLFCGAVAAGALSMAWPDGTGDGWRRAAAVASVLPVSTAFWRFLHARRRHGSWLLVISEAATMTLTPQPGRAKRAPGVVAGAAHEPAKATPVRLLEGSTIWPNLLVLRLESDGGRRIDLVILPDCLEARAMRRLAVACRWIAAQPVTPPARGR
jgi:toxin CptA